VHEAEVVLGVVVEARGDAAEVLEPRVEPLDLPTPPVAPELSAVLRRRLAAVRPVRRDQLDALLFKLGVERVGVVGAVAYEPSWSLASETRLSAPCANARESLLRLA
jgi:hypothetical protein